MNLPISSFSLCLRGRIIVGSVLVLKLFAHNGFYQHPRWGRSYIQKEIRSRRTQNGLNQCRSKGPPVQRKPLEHRDYQVDLESRLGWLLLFCLRVRGKRFCQLLGSHKREETSKGVGYVYAGREVIT
ncbi:PREDICTED: uncharacterized protein LOC104818744 [Tarenaya hassleriana]|uniref:uncharacterized protein LOC104818744 n=1 Tax=Tarenaya hassleriana TaxID=28532 RepID=UPI0008FCE803|nr:PREDICTED: uncharacterized protein LOC104818744 [Tarenaya hassleriana]